MKNARFLKFVIARLPAGAIFAMAAGFSPVRAVEGPPAAGLVAWLDASAVDTITLNDAGQVSVWKDRSGLGHDASGEAGPEVVDQSMLRFGRGKRSVLRLPALTAKTGAMTVLAVVRREAASLDDRKWQRVLSSAADGQQDNKEGGLMMVPDLNGPPTAFGPVVIAAQGFSVEPAAVFIGSREDGTQRLNGDIAEVLIYDHECPDGKGFEEAQAYLMKKWGAGMPRFASGWTRTGALPTAVKRTTESLPLTDQGNQGKWKSEASMSDEFNGTALDETKWWDHNPEWYGRPPALYLPENLAVRDGEIQLTIRKDPTVKEFKPYPEQKIAYGGYAAASFTSKTVTTYGCFEIRAKAAHCSATSAWWFVGSATDSAGKRYKNELDVFELPAGCPDHETNFGMNMHVFQADEDKDHWSNWGNWKAPFEWSADFHVFTFEWSPQWIRYHVDGHLVRTTFNGAWHTPQRMIFDMEIMDWLPFPPDSEFPKTFRVDYVRAWTRDDWQAKPGFTPLIDPSKETATSRKVRELQAARAVTH